MKAARLLLMGMACLCLSTILSASAASKGDVQVTYAYKGDLYSAIVKVNYQGGQKLRRETRLVSLNRPIGTLFILSPVILRRDQGLRWVVSDENRSYVELALRSEDTGLLFPNLKEFKKEKKAEVSGYVCQVYRSKKEADYFIWVLRPSNVVLRIERGFEDDKTIYEATDVSFGPQDNSLFEPPSGYEKLTVAELMSREITPPMIADALFGEAESVSVIGGMARQLNSSEIDELRLYVSGATMLDEVSSWDFRDYCWFTIKLRNGQMLRMFYDRPARCLFVDKRNVNWKWEYAYMLHPDLIRKFIGGDYRLGAPEDMSAWIEHLLTQ